MSLPAPAAAPVEAGHFGKKRLKWVIVAVFILALILALPIVPVKKTVMVAGTTATTITYQTTSSQTVLSTITQQSISVYEGSIVYVTPAYYNFYYIWYTQCAGFSTTLNCSYNYSPYYNVPGYTTTVNVSATQNIISVATTPGSYGLSTVTLTSQDGTATTYINVLSNALTQTGPTTTQLTTTVVNSITQTTSSVTNVACQNCIPQQVTVYVSLLQLLTGNY